MRPFKPDANRCGRTPRPVSKPTKAVRRVMVACALRPPSMHAREILALVRTAKAEERRARDAMQAYSVRQRLDGRLSALAEQIAAKRSRSPDDLLDLALAGWYATGARPALVRAVLRAGGIDPATPHRRARRVSRVERQR